MGGFVQLFLDRLPGRAFRVCRHFRFGRVVSYGRSVRLAHGNVCLLPFFTLDFVLTRIAGRSSAPPSGVRASASWLQWELLGRRSTRGAAEVFFTLLTLTSGSSRQMKIDDQKSIIERFHSRL